MSFLLDFGAKFVPHSYSARVAYQSVLWPLFGTTRDLSQIVRTSRLVTQQWRRRIDELVEQDWHVVVSGGLRGGRTRKWRMLNCKPAFFVPTQAATPCTVSAICPHCWARDAVRIWRKLDATLFPRAQDKRSDRCPYDVVLRTVSRRIKCEPWIHEPANSNPVAVDFLSSYVATRLGRNVEFRADVQSRPNEFRWLKRAGAVGGLDVMGFRLLRDTNGQPWEWEAIVHQLLVVPAGSVDLDAKDESKFCEPVSFFPRPLIPGEELPAIPAYETVSDTVREMLYTTCAVDVLATPNRREVVDAVSTMFQYPKFLLYGRPSRVRQFLDMRADKRLIATFGILQGPGPKSEEVTSAKRVQDGRSNTGRDQGSHRQDQSQPLEAEA